MAKGHWAVDSAARWPLTVSESLGRARHLGQQFAIDDIGRAHLSVRFLNGDVLIDGATAVGVVHRVGCDRLAIRRPQAGDFADQFAVIVVAFHNSSFVK